MLIALRRGAAPQSNFLQRKTSDFIRYRLATVWPHAGVYIGETLYHVNGSSGMSAEPLPPGEWDFVDVGGDDVEAVRIFDELRAQGGGYDYVELLGFTLVRPFLRLAAKIPRVAAKLALNTYCYQLALWMASGQRPTFRVTAELLLWHALKPKT